MWFQPHLWHLAGAFIQSNLQKWKDIFISFRQLGSWGLKALLKVLAVAASQCWDLNPQLFKPVSYQCPIHQKSFIQICFIIFKDIKSLKVNMILGGRDKIAWKLCAGWVVQPNIGGGYLVVKLDAHLFTCWTVAV